MTCRVCVKMYLNRIFVTGCLRRPIPFTSPSHAGLYSAILSPRNLEPPRNLHQYLEKGYKEKHSFSPIIIEKYAFANKEEVIAYVIIGFFLHFTMISFKGSQVKIIILEGNNFSCNAVGDLSIDFFVL